MISRRLRHKRGNRKSAARCARNMRNTSMPSEWPAARNSEVLPRPSSIATTCHKYRMLPVRCTPRQIGPREILDGRVQPVAFDIVRLERRRAPGRMRIAMLNDRAGNVSAFPSRPLRAQPQIGVFAVQKKILVEQSDLVEHLAAVQRCRSWDTARHARPRISRAIHRDRAACWIHRSR